ncbi:hypothetical protein NBM05_02120 [Rothia sp. AR01]|uniref:Uncharacterized protein n=1 Tax=Rothia santali TaxID=2949643 RepID=A0A9X2HBW2_9MICC|nr:hypothetical protein [Rothia santali]MCP3424857.1 hypothetical protein [Rothia santali]
MNVASAVKGRLPMVLALFAVVVLGWSTFFVTDRAAAAFTDRARLSFSEMGTAAYGIGVVDQNGLIRSSGQAKIGGPQFVRNVRPGRTAKTTFTVANNSPDLPMAMRLAVTAKPPADPSRPDYVPWMRVTIFDQDTGEILLGDTAEDGVNGAPMEIDHDVDLGTLIGRGGPPQEDEVPHVPGRPGSERRLGLWIRLLTPVPDREMNHGGFRLGMRLSGTPVIE